MTLENREWFGDEHKDDRGKAMLRVAEDLRSDPAESTRADTNLKWARMFEGAPVDSLYAYGGKFYAAPSNRAFDASDASTWNVLRSVVMTAHSMVGSSRPRGRFVTTGGNFKQKHRARKATQFCDGWADEADLYAVTDQVLRDAEVFDVGAIQVYEEGNRIKVQRVLAHELVVDPMDAMYGAPRTLYRRRFVDKYVLASKYGKGKPAVRASILATKGTDPNGFGKDTGMLEVWEAWHLPSAPGAGDGYHVIALLTGEGHGGEAEGLELVAEAWKKAYFPILLLRWEDSVAGVYGRSLVSQLAETQVQINLLLDKIERSQRLFSVPRVAIQRGSKIVESQLTNKIAGAIEYTTTPPTPLVWPALPPEVYKQLDKHVEAMYELPGISRNASQGQKDAGVTSAVAIRESLDVQGTRLKVFQQRWERFHVDIFKIVIDMVADIVADEGGYELTAPVPGSGLMEVLDWKTIGMDRKDYKITVYPASILPITPQGRLEYCQEMLKAGLWTKERALAVMDDLDPDSETSLELGMQRLLERQFEGMLYDAEPDAPDDYTPFDQALRIGGMYLSMGRSEGAPEKNLDLIRRYLEELKALQPKQPAPMPQMPAGPGGPAPMPADPMAAGAMQAPLSPLPAAFAGGAA